MPKRTWPINRCHSSAIHDKRDTLIIKYVTAHSGGMAVNIMPYTRRTYPYMNRKYRQSEKNPGPKDLDSGYEEAIAPERLANVPLPNEKEEEPGFTADRNIAKRQPSILSFLKDKINIEELILIGLIFLMLDEGIDDEFLLILLIYILLG